MRTTRTTRTMWTVLAVPALLLATACSPTDPAPVTQLRIAAGQDGGVYYELGHALAGEARRRWSVPADVLQTNESVDNLRKLDSGEADVGFTTLDVGMAALRGNRPFHAAVRVSALAGIYVDYLHVVVRADSGIGSLQELAHRRVAIGPNASGLHIVASRVMPPMLPYTPSNLPPAEAAQALRVGDIDAFFMLGGLPTPLVEDLADQLEIRVLPVDAEYPRLRSEFSDMYLLRSIPKGVYRMPGPVMTLGVPNALMVRADLPDQTAYRLTELLFAAKPSLAKAYSEVRHLDHRSALATFPLPLHRGAERYYQEAKPMTAFVGIEET